MAVGWEGVVVVVPRLAQVAIANRGTLRDSSPVSNSWRPKQWQIELMLKVAW